MKISFRAICFLQSVVLGGAFHAIVRADDAPLYRDANAPLEKRVEDLFGRLNQDEKLKLLSGTGFTTQPIPRLNIPAMMMADAGQGVRGGNPLNSGPATAFPSGVAMASSWNTELIRGVGQAIGEEARNKGAGSQVLLGPAVNIQRSPLGGRNGEYFSEDPFLAARLAVAYIQGMQGTGVAACIKHYACNNQEFQRGSVDVKVDERTLREIYLPAFEAGVKEGKVWTVMSSYNQINGHHATANPYLLIDVMKKGWNFDGLIMSDWGAVHEVGTVQAGNDLEMPRGEHTSAEKVAAALAAGTATQAAVDDAVRPILRTLIRVGLLDPMPKPDASRVNSKEHQELARHAAEEAIVLLKNEGGLLPLDRQKVHSIAVIGPAANELIVGALGSPEVRPFYKVQFYEGIKKAAPEIDVSLVPGERDRALTADNVTVPGGTEKGFKAEYFSGTELKGAPLLTRTEDRIQLDTDDPPTTQVPATNYSVRWTASLVAPATGSYLFSFVGDDGFRVKLDGKTIIESWKDGSSRRITANVNLVAGKAYPLQVEYFQATGDAVAKLNWILPSGDPYSEAVAAAAKADVAVVCVSTQHTEGEGRDRPSMDLPNDQDELIKPIAVANKNTIVVLNNGTPVTMNDWIHQVPGVIEAWLPGEEGGTALASILFGDVNPSGKLPTTLAVNRADYPDNANFPGTQGVVKYEEGIYVGYRHFDKSGIDPLFPFGFGLSYTTFDYRNLRLSSPALKSDGNLQVTIDVTNSGTRAGEEVVELYVHDPAPQIDRPVRELKGFAKVALQPGETKPVTFTVTPRDLAFFDVLGKQWKAPAGAYEIEVGSSSRDLRQKISVNLESDFTESVPLSRATPE